MVYSYEAIRFDRIVQDQHIGERMEFHVPRAELVAITQDVRFIHVGHTTVDAQFLTDDTHDFSRVGTPPSFQLLQVSTRELGKKPPRSLAVTEQFPFERIEISIRTQYSIRGQSERRHVLNILTPSVQRTHDVPRLLPFTFRSQLLPASLHYRCSHMITLFHRWFSAYPVHLGTR
ncbi:hypothetical protein CPA40_01725 [Bifidobacterium callitrichos]|uniref:Uncharacterized protein n=1 Tax=Bifidobacterium callitrichos TaxID=762209 RepID=A0A2T3GC66_9BIFI|nr:hypothetical protein CPA40_01725 [Bifidobacterium callitrichos]